MSHLDSCRRAGSIVLVVACLLLVPGAAMARFTDRQAPALSVATDSMERPTAVTGTCTCGGQGNTESVRIDVTGFTDAGPSRSPLHGHDVRQPGAGRELDLARAVARGEHPGRQGCQRLDGRNPVGPRQLDRSGVLQAGHLHAEVGNTGPL